MLVTTIERNCYKWKLMQIICKISNNKELNVKLVARRDEMMSVL